MGPTELILIMLIVVLLFGAAKLPKLARSLGESAKEFKAGVAEAENRDRDSGTNSGGDSSSSSS